MAPFRTGNYCCVCCDAFCLFVCLFDYDIWWSFLGAEFSTGQILSSYSFVDGDDASWKVTWRVESHFLLFGIISQHFEGARRLVQWANTYQACLGTCVWSAEITHTSEFCEASPNELLQFSRSSWHGQKAKVRWKRCRARRMLVKDHLIGEEFHQLVDAQACQDKWSTRKWLNVGTKFSLER